MKKGFKSIYFLIVFVGVFFQNSHAQDPNWTLNASDFQYSMTFTAFLSLENETLTSQNDKVAAFVNGEVRGVSQVQYVPSANKYLTYLTVYANTNSETINFKIYDSSANTVVATIKTHVFSIDGNVGGISQSYSIANPELSDQAIMLSFEFKDITSVEEELLANTIGVMLPENTEVSALIAVFTSSTNSKVLVNGLQQTSGLSSQDFNSPIHYIVLSEDETNFVDYEVTVTFQDSSNTDPTVTISSSTGLHFSTTPVTLDVVFSKVVSDFETSDFSTENAIVSSLSTLDNRTYQVELVPITQGSFSLEIPSNSLLDTFGNPNEASNKLDLEYDAVRPIISEVNIEEDSNSWWFTVTFNELVTNVDSSDFELTGMASTGLVIAEVSSLSENQYRINVSNVSLQEGVVSLSIQNDNNIKDVAGNSVVFTSYDAFFITNTLSYSDVFLQEKLTVYPNPVETVLNIKSVSSSTIKAEIYSIDHKKILSKTAKNQIDVRTLSKGIYFIKLQQDHRTQFFKFIKK